MTTTTRTERDAQIIEQYRADLMRGTTFYRAAASADSADRMNYAGSLRARPYGEVLITLGGFARHGDWNADVVSRLVGSINLYGSPWQVASSIAMALAKIVADGWFDTVNYTGPEGGRASDNQHPTTERQAVLLALLYIEIEHAIGGLGHVPGIGWTLAAIAEEHDLGTVPRYLFPRIADKQAKS